MINLIVNKISSKRYLFRRHFLNYIRGCLISRSEKESSIKRRRKIPFQGSFGKRRYQVPKSSITRPATPALFHGRCPLVYAPSVFIYFTVVVLRISLSLSLLFFPLFSFFFATDVRTFAVLVTAQFVISRCYLSTLSILQLSVPLISCDPHDDYRTCPKI